AKGVDENPESSEKGTQEFPLIVHVDKRPQSKEEASDDKKAGDLQASLEDWNIVLGAAVAVAAFLQFIAVLIQARINHNQTRFFRNVERAWILVRRVGQPPEGLIDPENPTHNPGIALQFQNFGNTPAEIIDCRFCFEIVNRRESPAHPAAPDLPEVPDYKRAARNTNIPDLKAMRPPRDKFTLIASLASPPRESEIGELKYNRKFLCVYGFITYLDVFGREGETRFSYIYDFAIGGAFTTLDKTRLNPPGFRTGGPSSYNQAT
ncbi:MAG: hypothetical protein WBD06_10535, partial [Acidobacteriaceae bacterium]